MASRRSRLKLLLLGPAVIILSAFPALAQVESDPDPNSPTPILLTFDNSTRALATQASNLRNIKPVNLSIPQPQAFSLGQKVDLYVTNVDLMKGEGASAFRLYVTDRLGHEYRFPVVDLQQTYSRNTYALTVLLRDEIGYWPLPSQDGDVAAMITWRGLASNYVKLGLGKMGGDMPDPANSQPAPLSRANGKIQMQAAPPQSPDFIGYYYAGDRARVQEQGAFGWSPMLDERIRRIGLRAWLASQFDEPYPSVLNPYPNQPLKPASAPPDCDGDQTVTPDVPVTCFRDTYSMYPLQTWFFREALYGDAQLRHQVAWALSQIWVTSGNDIQQSRHMVEYHKILSQNAFGNYRTLMKQMTLDPTMGDYLSMAASTKNNPNENYGREIMQLFTVGLFMLNPDGTLQTDGSGNPIPTYDQTVVTNMTKVFTGWSYCSIPASCPNNPLGAVNYIDPMLLNGGVSIVSQNRHDLTAKTLLSYTGSTTTNIAACGNCTTLPNILTYANASMDQALDNIYNHPNVGPFVCKNLIQHLVTSDPTPAYVGRVAAVFNANRSNPTQLKEVIRAILLDPEARGDVKTDPHYGKLREPVEFVTNFLRTFKVTAVDGVSQTDGFLTGRSEFTGMSQIPFQAPTVFNYYPPDYVVPGTTFLGPEFTLMTTGTSIQRANFMNRFIFTAPAIAVSSPNSPQGMAVDFSDLQNLEIADPTNGTLLDTLNQRMLHGTMSSTMRNSINTAVNSITVSNPPTASQALSRVRQAVYLVATSSQYQVQR
jgi:uncharacterized protein (DUF1800 family)